MRVFQELTDDFEQDTANQMHPLQDWSIICSTLERRTWASAILSNQWVGRREQRTSVRAVFVREAETPKQHQRRAYVEPWSITGESAHIHHKEQAEITRRHLNDYFINASSYWFLFLLSLCWFYFHSYTGGGEKTTEQSFTAANQFPFSRPGNYNETCRWHISIHYPRITIGIPAEATKKEAGKKSISFWALLLWEAWKLWTGVACDAFNHA